MASFHYLYLCPQQWPSVPLPSECGGVGMAGHQLAHTPNPGRPPPRDGLGRVTAPPDPYQAESWPPRWTPMSDESVLLIQAAPGALWPRCVRAVRRPTRRLVKQAAAAVRGWVDGQPSSSPSEAGSGPTTSSNGRGWPVTGPIRERAAQARRSGHRRSRRGPRRPRPWVRGLACPTANKARGDLRPNRLVGKTDPPRKKNDNKIKADVKAKTKSGIKRDLKRHTRGNPDERLSL